MQTYLQWCPIPSPCLKASTPSYSRPSLEASTLSWGSYLLKASTLPWGTQFFNIVNASKNPSQLCDANAFKTASSQMSPPHAPPPPRACKPREREPADSSHTARKPACPSRVSDVPPAAKTAGEASRHSSRTAGQTSDPAQRPHCRVLHVSLRRLGCSCFSRCETQRARKDRVSPPSRAAQSATAPGNRRGAFSSTVRRRRATNTVHYANQAPGRRVMDPGYLDDMVL